MTHMRQEWGSSYNITRRSTALWGERERVQYNAERVFSCMHMQSVKFVMSPVYTAGPIIKL